MWRPLAAILSAAVLATAAIDAKEDPPPPGLIAASVGESVLLADPASDWSETVEAGPVGWLFEAPGGVLFAPDLIDGRTTVIDLRSRRVADRLDGVTMPHFAPGGDRYVAVAGEVLLVTYPERAVVTRVDANIRYPWQVEMVSDTAVLVLERGPDGTGGAVLYAVDMVARQVVYRRPLPGDVRRFALSRELGMLAFADASSSKLQLVDPATLTSVATLDAGHPVRDVAFLDAGDRSRIAAVAGAEGEGGVVKVWDVKAKKGELRIKKERALTLAGLPNRLAVSPGQDRLAVATDAPAIVMVDAGELEPVRSIELPAEARDLVWCNPARPGPLLPDWSDDDPPELRLGPK